MKRRQGFIALALSLFLVLAACGGEEAGDNTVETREEGTAEVATQTPVDPTEGLDAAQDTANTTETTEPAATSHGTDWNTAYQQFILQKGWLKAERGEDLGEDASAVVFQLHDMDGDGIPELLARNEVADFGEMGYYVYTWDGSKMAFLGEMGFLGGSLWQSDTGDYPGLFHYAGMGDSYLGYYYDWKNGQLRQTLVVTDMMVLSGDSVSCESTVETADEDLYTTYTRTKGGSTLSMYTADEISAMSWESFAR